MIQNLNFYDIYGYLIPGLTLAILVWLPHGLIRGHLPTTDWTSALAAIVIGYVIGQVLQVLGRNALPSRTLDGRYPSEALLDKDNSAFSDNLKARLRERISTLSGIDVRTDVKRCDVTPKVSAQRRDGFYFCRDALLTSKTISYGEQMQGMYALMDGLTVAFALGAAYNFGWVLSGLGYGALQQSASTVVVLGLVGAVVIAALSLRKNALRFRHLMTAQELQIVVDIFGLGQNADSPENARMTRARWMVGFLMFALIASGYRLGMGKVSNLDQRGLFFAITLASIFASLTCFAAYKYFTRMYAETIYRAFNLYEKPNKAAASAGTEEN